MKTYSSPKNFFCITKPTKTQSEIVLILCGVLLGIFRVILSENLNYNFVGNSDFDDYFQNLQAYNIAQGEWLGDYSKTTLIKSLSYPIFSAFFYKFGISLGIGFGLMALFSAITFVIAFRPFISKPLLFIGYLWVLYSPVGFQNRINLRLYRNSLCGYAVFLVIIVSVGLFLRIKSKKGLVFWSGFYGMVITFFWNLREDSIWLLPFIGASLLLTFISFFIYKRNLLYGIVVTLLPIMILFLSLSAIRETNYKIYGVRLTNDRTTGEFSQMMKLLYSIEDPSNKNPDVWLSRNMINSALENSQTFFGLKENILTYWNTWAGPGEEITGDLGQWIIRDAVSSAGYYLDAKETQELYKKISEELEISFKEGGLKKGQGIILSSQAKMFRSLDIKNAFKTSAFSGFHILNNTYAGVPFPKYASGESKRVLLMEKVSGIKALREGDSRLYSRQKLFSDFVNIFIKIYRIFGWIVFLISFIMWVIAIISIIRKTNGFEYTLGFIIQTGIAINAILGIYIVSLFCSFRVDYYFIYFYLCGIFPLVQSVQMYGVYSLIKSFKNKGHHIEKRA